MPRTRAAAVDAAGPYIDANLTVSSARTRAEAQISVGGKLFFYGPTHLQCMHVQMFDEDALKLVNEPPDISGWHPNRQNMALRRNAWQALDGTVVYGKHHGKLCDISDPTAPTCFEGVKPGNWVIHVYYFYCGYIDEPNLKIEVAVLDDEQTTRRLAIAAGLDCPSMEGD